MSVIVKAICDKNDILIFTKGADSAIFDKSVSYKYQASFESNINEFAIEGLRTLVFGYRKISEEEIAEFKDTKRKIAL